MSALSRDDLFGLEEYSLMRPEFRKKVMEHKKHRKLPVGPNVMLVFEDRLTMHYQVQEMLRAERIFEAAAIQEELDAYNPLIPDGGNWKATCMIEFPDEDERREALRQLVGIENCIWMQIGEHDKVWAIADEDLERTTEVKTSSVHFLRFELQPSMATALKAGAPLSAGIAHAAYDHVVSPVPQPFRQSLARDLA